MFSPLRFGIAEIGISLFVIVASPFVIEGAACLFMAQNLVSGRNRRMSGQSIRSGLNFT